MNARERILARLRSSAPVSPLPAPAIAGHYANAANEDRAVLLERFRTAIEAAHAEVISTTASEWPAVLRRLCVDKGVRTLLAAPALTAFDDGSEALQVIHFELSIDGRKAALFEEVDAALTHSVCAIAETGTLVLIPDADEPRTQSLVPPIHFVLLDAGRIHADLYTAMTDGDWAKAMPTNLLLISGPSKTADIQQTLAYGAHGPKELIVLLLLPEGRP